jgi:tRNA 2-thiouridine synthesizing protein A
MEWQFIVVLAVVIPIILFTAVFVWYMNVRGVHAVMKEARMNAAELKNLKIAKQVDARGTAYQGLLAARRAMVSVPKGGVLEVLSPDEGTNQDIPLWCGKVGHKYLGTIEGPGYWRIFVKRAE